MIFFLVEGDLHIEYITDISGCLHCFPPCCYYVPSSYLFMYTVFENIGNKNYLLAYFIIIREFHVFAIMMSVMRQLLKVV